MASLRMMKSGNYIICFRYHGQQYQRSLRTRNRKAAEAIYGKIEHTLFQLATGNQTIPEHVDPGDFIVNGLTSPRRQKSVAPPPSFAVLIEQYLTDCTGQKARSSLKTERTHLNNLRERLGSKADTPIHRLTKDDLETALRKRCQQVAATTVMKERQSLISFFTWAVGKDETQLRSSPADKLCTFQKDREKKRFRTLPEIEQILVRGGLADENVEDYWDCLYLDQAQIGEILGIYHDNARHDFIYPMVSLAAFTGMRRGEILRLRWSDINFDAGFVTARSRKQSRQMTETSRDIPMHSMLRDILMAHLKNRPSGQYVICKAGSSEPITKDMAHDHFQRTLHRTRWERPMPSGKKRIVVGFHTFRHSFASNLALQAVDQRLIDAMMGHQTEEMRKRYQHLFPQSRTAAVESLSFGPVIDLAGETSNQSSSSDRAS